MLVSNQILISNRNETYSKSAFGSQMVILLKILSLDFFFNKKPRMPRWLYVSCYFRMGCVPSQKITFATSNVWVDAAFTISKSSSFCSNFLSRFLWDNENRFESSFKNDVYKAYWKKLPFRDFIFGNWLLH